MAVRVSRRKLAAYTAEQLMKADQTVITQLAAYLVETRRTKELPLLVRDIESALAAHGVVVADVTTVGPLGAAAEKAVRDFVASTQNASSVQLRTIEDPALLAGVKISLPGSELDTSVRRKLTALKATKV
jgi:F0F1-type ATP synthase delta subunit